MFFKSSWINSMPLRRIPSVSLYFDSSCIISTISYSILYPSLILLLHLYNPPLNDYSLYNLQSSSGKTRSELTRKNEKNTMLPNQLCPNNKKPRSKLFLIWFSDREGVCSHDQTEETSRGDSRDPSSSGRVSSLPQDAKPIVTGCADK